MENTFNWTIILTLVCYCILLSGCRLLVYTLYRRRVRNERIPDLRGFVSKFCNLPFQFNNFSLYFYIVYPKYTFLGRFLLPFLHLILSFQSSSLYIFLLHVIVYIILQSCSSPSFLFFWWASNSIFSLVFFPPACALNGHPYHSSCFSIILSVILQSTFTLFSTVSFFEILLKLFFFSSVNTTIKYSIYFVTNSLASTLHICRKTCNTQSPTKYL